MNDPVTDEVMRLASLWATARVQRALDPANVGKQERVAAAEASLRACVESVVASEAVAEVYRYGFDSAGRHWHGIHWYDRDVDVPTGTKLYLRGPVPKKKDNDGT